MGQVNHGYPSGYPRAPQFIRVDVPVQLPFVVEAVNMLSIESFNPDIRDWMEQELAEPSWVRCAVSETNEPDEDTELHIDFVFRLHFSNIQDATMFKLRWMG